MSKLIIASPANGKVILASKINDESFSKDMIGEGFGIITTVRKGGRKLSLMWIRL